MTQLDELTEALRHLVEVVEAHELVSLSCDRDGKEFCECLDEAVKRAKRALGENAPLSFGDWVKSLEGE